MQFSAVSRSQSVSRKQKWTNLKKILDEKQKQAVVLTQGSVRVSKTRSLLDCSSENSQIVAAAAGPAEKWTILSYFCFIMAMKCKLSPRNQNNLVLSSFYRTTVVAVDFEHKQLSIFSAPDRNVQVHGSRWETSHAAGERRERRRGNSLEINGSGAERLSRPWSWSGGRPGGWSGQTSDTGDLPETESDPDDVHCSREECCDGQLGPDPAPHARMMRLNSRTFFGPQLNFVHG